MQRAVLEGRLLPSLLPDTFPARFINASPLFRPHCISTIHLEAYIRFSSNTVAAWRFLSTLPPVLRISSGGSGWQTDAFRRRLASGTISAAWSHRPGKDNNFWSNGYPSPCFSGETQMIWCRKRGGSRLRTSLEEQVKPLAETCVIDVCWGLCNH